MMKNSSSHPKYEETSYYDAHGFDLRDDFSQFMEEARNHKEAKLKSSLVHPEEENGKKKSEEKKGKKSWKNSLLSWCKGDTEGKNRLENSNNNSQCHVSGKKNGQAVSRPMYRIGKDPDRKFKGSTSGPLTSLFKPTKRLEDEMPYISLLHQSSPPSVQSYGPIYKVT